jgi:hypothetical protein
MYCVVTHWLICACGHNLASIGQLTKCVGAVNLAKCFGLNVTYMTCMRDRKSQSDGQSSFVTGNSEFVFR